MWKTKNFYKLAFIAISFAITSCNNNKVSWIDTKEWKKDYKGCGIYREKLIPDLELRKMDLLDKTDAFFFQTLGRANRVSYGERGKKIFYYYLTPGSQCGNSTKKTACLTIEFEALGTSRLIYIEEIML